MKQADFARQLPEEIWAVFEPLLPLVVWRGNGRPPASNYDCLHSVFYVLVSGIAWRMLPKGFPSYKTVQRRLQVWLQLDPFRTEWQDLGQRYETLHGVNWDRIFRDTPKKPATRENPGPAPSVDRGKCGTALSLAGDALAMLPAEERSSVLTLRPTGTWPGPN